MGWERWSIWSKAEWKTFAILTGVLFVIAPVLAGLGLPWADCLRWFSETSAGAGVLWATGIVILLYTIETQRMRREMVRQNEITIQPVLMVRLEEREVPPYVILHNIGRGPAMHVQISEVVLGEEAERRVSIQFPRVDYILAGVEQNVWPDHFREGPRGVERYNDALAFLNPRTATARYDLTLSYEDVGGQRHQSVVWMGQGGVRLVRHGKV